MSSLAIHVFKESFGPFLQLLNDHKVRYTMEGTRSGTFMSASAIFEILLSPGVLASLSAIIIAYLKYRPTRRVTITVGNKVFHAEGLTAAQIEQLLGQAKSIAVIETSPDAKASAAPSAPKSAP
jgi:hypothetical protein